MLHVYTSATDSYLLCKGPRQHHGSSPTFVTLPLPVQFPFQAPTPASSHASIQPLCFNLPPNYPTQSHQTSSSCQSSFLLWSSLLQPCTTTNSLPPRIIHLPPATSESYTYPLPSHLAQCILLLKIWTHLQFPARCRPLSPPTSSDPSPFTPLSIMTPSASMPVSSLV